MPAASAEKVKVPARRSRVALVPSGVCSIAARLRASPEGEESLSRGETTVWEPATTRTWSALATGVCASAARTSTVTVPEAVWRPSETTTVSSRVPGAPCRSRTVTTPSFVVRTSRPSPCAETR